MSGHASRNSSSIAEFISSLAEVYGLILADATPLLCNV